jgi:integrase
MPRTVRNPKIDTRTARLRLPQRREPYWTVLSEGCALGYRRGARGGTWIGKFRAESGQRCIAALGAADDALDPDGLSALSFAQAQERARDWFKQQARLAAGGVALAGTYTVADALRDYERDYRRRGGKAVYRQNTSVAAWILPVLGPIPLEKLTKWQIEGWHAKLAEMPPRVRTKAGAMPKHRPRDRSPEGIRRRRSSANRTLTTLKAALNHAFREGHCATDTAWRRVLPFREADAARVRYLSDDDARRLVNACQPDLRRLVVAALLTGARYGELCAAVVDDFEPDAGTLRVRFSKGGRSRHIVLTNEGQSHFAGLAVGRPGSARLLLRGNGRPWTKSEQQRPLVAACRAAQIDPPVSFHDLRHTYASRAVMNGMALPVVAAQLGHTSTRMVERHYAHLAPSFVALAVRQTFGELGIVEPANVVPLGR